MKLYLTGIYTLGLALRAIAIFYSFQYDSGGIAGGIFWLSAVLAFPAWIFDELLFSMGDGKAFVGYVLTGLLEYVLTLAGDKLISKFQSRRRVA